MYNYPDGITSTQWRYIDGDADKGELLGRCACCDSPIYEEDDHYNFADLGIMVCEDCVENGRVRGA